MKARPTGRDTDSCPVTGGGLHRVTRPVYGYLGQDDDFEERLTGYLDQFVDCRWPRLYLTADALGDPPDQPL